MDTRAESIALSYHDMPFQKPVHWFKKKNENLRKSTAMRDVSL